MKKLSPNAIGLAAAILSAVCMLVIGVLAMFEFRMEAFEMMKTMHIWFDATVVGVLLGMVEAFVFSYVVGYLFALLYNKLA
ncbi:MAG: hypothetical protein GWP15_01810 [Nitrospirae bacterium]|nr:hypothetical protein [Nitrospirota bacterium]